MNLRIGSVVVAGILLASVELVYAYSQKGDEVGEEVGEKAVHRTLAASCANKISDVPATRTRKVQGVAGKLPTKPSSFQSVNLRQGE